MSGPFGGKGLARRVKRLMQKRGRLKRAQKRHEKIVNDPALATRIQANIDYIHATNSGPLKPLPGQNQRPKRR